MWINDKNICHTYLEISGSWILHRKAHTLHIWLMTPNKLNGTTLCQIRKFLILFIALSTWILTLPICCVRTTSSADIWLSPPRNGGMLRVTPKGKISWIWNPLSAMTESPSSSFAQQFPCQKYCLCIIGSQKWWHHLEKFQPVFLMSHDFCRSWIVRNLKVDYLAFHKTLPYSLLWLL